MKIFKKLKKYIKEVIYTLPQAPFSPKNIQIIMKIRELQKKHEKHIKEVIYTLPQAPFSQRNIQKLRKI